MELTQAQLIEILTRSLSTFREEIDPDITAVRILTLLTTVKNPGLQQLDVAEHVKGLTTSSISRNVVDWGELTSTRKPGPDFIQQRPDPMYRKRNLLYPTPKGLAFITKLVNKVNHALNPRTRGGTKH